MQLWKAAVTVVVAVSGGCASNAHNIEVVEELPVAVTEDGDPIFQLSESDLISVFRNVQVRYPDASPPIAESFHAGGGYSAGGEWLEEGRFWVAHGELCARVAGQTGETLCRRFGRSPDGEVYEISGSRGKVPIPYRYNLRPLPG